MISHTYVLDCRAFIHSSKSRSNANWSTNFLSGPGHAHIDHNVCKVSSVNSSKDTTPVKFLKIAVSAASTASANDGGTPISYSGVVFSI